MAETTHIEDEINASNLDTTLTLEQTSAEQTEVAAISGDISTMQEITSATDTQKPAEQNIEDETNIPAVEINTVEDDTTIVQTESFVREVEAADGRTEEISNSVKEVDDGTEDDTIEFKTNADSSETAPDVNEEVTTHEEAVETKAESEYSLAEVENPANGEDIVETELAGQDNETATELVSELTSSEGTVIEEGKEGTDETETAGKLDQPDMVVETTPETISSDTATASKTTEIPRETETGETPEIAREDKPVNVEFAEDVVPGEARIWYELLGLQTAADEENELPTETRDAGAFPDESEEIQLTLADNTDTTEMVAEQPDNAVGVTAVDSTTVIIDAHTTPPHLAVLFPGQNNQPVSTSNQDSISGSLARAEVLLAEAKSEKMKKRNIWQKLFGWILGK
jgi:hypothetical protein